MGPYKPKRFEWTQYEGNYGVGLTVATEPYSNENGRFRDFYLSFHIGIGSLHVVFWRHRITS